MPFHPLKNHNYLQHTEAESFTAQNDKTLFSRIAITLDSAVEHLLLHDQVEGVPQDLHEAFRVSHVSTAYRCRYPHCPKASAGFASESARSQHEKCHFHRLYCNYEGCSYSRIGFDKHSSLVSHKQRYHAAKASLMIPPRIRGGGNSSSEGRELTALADDAWDLGLNFGDGDAALENFDFDSFLRKDDDPGTPGGFYTFPDGFESLE
jgi:hypothetical protein